MRSAKTRIKSLERWLGKKHQPRHKILFLNPGTRNEVEAERALAIKEHEGKDCVLIIFVPCPYSDERNW